jgi:hypothetical protein
VRDPPASIIYERIVTLPPVSLNALVREAGAARKSERARAGTKVVQRLISVKPHRSSLWVDFLGREGQHTGYRPRVEGSHGAGVGPLELFDVGTIGNCAPRLHGILRPVEAFLFHLMAGSLLTRREQP